MRMPDYNLMAQALTNSQGLGQYGLREGMGNPGEPFILKGKGYFGEIPTEDGSVMTEYSGISNFGDKDVEHPFLVPTLNKQEVDLLRMTGEVTPEIARKAQIWAQSRMEKGQDPFATQSDIRFPYPTK